MSKYQATDVDRPRAGVLVYEDDIEDLYKVNNEAYNPKRLYLLRRSMSKLVIYRWWAATAPLLATTQLKLLIRPKL